METADFSFSFLTGRDIYMLTIVFLCLVMMLDDIFVDCLAFFGGIKPHKIRPEEFTRMYSLEEKRIGIFMANWHEDQVLELMVSGNVKSVNYTNYKLLIGVYPNDIPTLEAAQRLEKKFPQFVQVIINTEQGPTSKGQLVNLMANYVDEFNRTAGNVPYDLIMTHDAEDVIHKDSLKLINMRARDYDFIQIPVYSLPIPLSKFTAGIYIDEFVECHTKDVLVRDFFDAGFPAAGVGTVTSYKVLQILLKLQDGHYLKQNTLTEDYFLGLTCHDLKLPSKFSCDYYEVKDPNTGKIKREYIATRELFPQKVKQSIKQKTRWTLGISLQGLSERPWIGSNFFATYFTWRDRKGLFNAPIFTASMFFSVYFTASYFTFGNWPQLQYIPMRHTLSIMMWSIFMFTVLRIVNRIYLVSRIYGIKMGILAPARWILSNFINTACTYNAIHQWATAKYRGKLPTWSKTEHIVPEGFGTLHLEVVESATVSATALAVGPEPMSKFKTPSVSV